MGDASPDESQREVPHMNALRKVVWLWVRDALNGPLRLVALT
jgi:hypothetical protein